MSRFIYKGLLCGNKSIKSILDGIGDKELQLIACYDDKTERQKLIYFISKADIDLAKQIGPSGKEVLEYNKQIEMKQAKLPPMFTLFRKERNPSKKNLAIGNNIIKILTEDVEGKSWLQLTQNYDKYIVLSSIENLCERGRILKQKNLNGFVYKINQ